MNFQELCSLIAEKEGLKKEVGMGNIREVTKLILNELAGMPFSDIAKLLKNR